MRRPIITTSLSLSAILILDSMNVWHALAMFFLVGNIPGTDLSLSASTMLSLYTLAGGFVLARISIAALNSATRSVQA